MCEGAEARDIVVEGYIDLDSSCDEILDSLTKSSQRRVAKL